jgi:osmotically-inducible protein OsmY
MSALKLFTMAVLSTSLFFSGCKPKYPELKTSVEEKLKAMPATAAASVSVTDGVVTLTGELADETAKAESEKIAAAVKGVKSVVNNITLTPPPISFTPPVIVSDDPLAKSVTDATKDYPGVTATVNDGVITLTGSIAKTSLKKLMMTLNGLNAKKIDNQLTIK